MIIYLAGPITGVPDFQQRFAAAATALTSQGHAVINPATLPAGMTEAAYMDICLAYVRNCDAVYMLPGWQKSDGACCERLLAIKCGKPVREL